ncbi:MAG: 2,5-diamino-6-(ribosylamino)-4(3H)-pyrimidinone 5'-phosphate reductase [Candidatus Methanospirare jalkutatii]|nr:2,5-diamino-6-(ribosylamino)-4(3H)-pyrimidinone 5'-phosphate reductase [Candidatus Methanospirare jalkutatii]
MRLNAPMLRKETAAEGKMRRESGSLGGEDWKKPFVFINVAMSADGKIATKERRQTRISGEEDLKRVDALRAESDAILVGIGTVLADNPSLTVKSDALRKWRKMQGKDENPMRVVVDSKARTPENADFLVKGEGKRLIVVAENAPAERVERLRRKAEVLVCGVERVNLRSLMRELWRRGVRKLMVEGGATLNWSLLSEGLVDEIYTFVGNMIIGGKDAPSLVEGEGFIASEMLKLSLIGVERLNDGVLLRWRVLKPQKSPQTPKIY